jgi:hypothetical protein
MYRWVIGRLKGSHAYHLCNVVFEQSVPVVLCLIDPSDYRKARYEADRKRLIKLHSSGHLEILLHERTRTKCSRCGALTYRHEAIRGGECTGCSTLLPYRQGHAKQLDRPRVC